MPFFTFQPFMLRSFNFFLDKSAVPNPSFILSKQPNSMIRSIQKFAEVMALIKVILTAFVLLDMA